MNKQHKTIFKDPNGCQWLIKLSKKGDRDLAGQVNRSPDLEHTIINVVLTDGMKHTPKTGLLLFGSFLNLPDYDKLKDARNKYFPEMSDYTLNEVKAWVMSCLHYLPSGRYFVGDPCYFLSEENKRFAYGEYMKRRENNDINPVFLSIEGKILAMVATIVGDGGFKDQDKREYSVDSGTLGAIPFDLLEDRPNMVPDDLGKIHRFNKPFQVKRGLKSTIHFGKIRIKI